MDRSPLLADAVTDMAVEADRLLITAGFASLFVFGASSRAAPIGPPIGAFTKGHRYALRVHVDGDRALVADGPSWVEPPSPGNRIRLFDISDSSRPRPIAEAMAQGTTSEVLIGDLVRSGC